MMLFYDSRSRKVWLTPKLLLVSQGLVIHYEITETHTNNRDASKIVQIFQAAKV